jgi:hypothetical protein
MSIQTELATLAAGNFLAYAGVAAESGKNPVEFQVIAKAAMSARDAEAKAWETLLIKINALS